MKLKELIESIDKTQKGIEAEPSWYELSLLFDIYGLSWSEDTRLKCYWLKCWKCTDTWVGWRVYFLDDEFVCCSSQMSRKSDENFEFKDNNSAIKIKDYLRSLMDYNNGIEVDLWDENQEIGEDYAVEYSGGLLSTFHKKAVHEITKQEVEIIAAADNHVNFHKVIIKLPSGEEKEADSRQLRFKYATTYQKGHIEKLKTK